MFHDSLTLARLKALGYSSEARKGAEVALLVEQASFFAGSTPMFRYFRTEFYGESEIVL